MLTIVCALMYISYYCYSTVFENDSICSTIKLRLRDAGLKRTSVFMFEIQEIDNIPSPILIVHS